MPTARELRTEGAVLVLEDGRRFAGRAWGARGRTFGEAVFTTGMTGYQETLTDPSYAGQIVVMTAPHIGNTGMNDEDPESDRIWVAGYAAHRPSRVASSFRSQRTLDDELERDGIVAIAGIDTRAVVRYLRDKGAMRSAIFSGDDLALPEEQQLALVLEQPSMAGRNLSAEVSTTATYTEPARGERIGSVVIVDLGIKAATIGKLADRGFDVHVVPESVTVDELYALEPSAVFYSNGPGDPEASEHHIGILREVLTRRTPFFGICFGNQLLGRALGFGTYKLPFGHRGINQPVVDLRSGRIGITAHNHGFAVDAPRGGPVETPNGYGRAEVTHVDLNDDVVEGIACLDIPAFSVQYHPEAAAGPHDADGLFDRFRDMVLAERAGGDAAAIATLTAPTDGAA
ncbi:glutamine-hydrolyzing carbamoyl-phosphate synthase small subunit [uncultured Amnibacterium sp.]|uniref:glutamine-hydrolyzing carbamoyl-phosphate synthase small subunit n=1 Tax=uncultured Amnibacterium sp. TaxID=1631851 RepID=UPI0035CB45B9